ncbi:MAG: DUF3027 domain-containing protein [Rothia sp. (in: high G+C Gram-positive bacteria)]|nr:DUF3027 domain-containing protein [Rothia sp. (in: high G+C Gram-positive bacteria)]
MSEKDSTQSNPIPELLEHKASKRRRPAKADSVLAAAKDVALQGILEVTRQDYVGSGHRLQPEEERLLTHLFDCLLPGYRGWYWFATLARVPRSKKVSVCEVGLIPGSEALLAPDWLPWAERLKNIKPEELEQLEDQHELSREQIADLAAQEVAKPLELED